MAEVNGHTAGLPLATAALRALLGYDTIVRSNGSADVIAAVACDEHGEVFDEVIDVARDSGVDASAFDDSAAFVWFVECYRKLLAEEIPPMPAGG